MGINELTHEAISLALTNDEPLSHNQRVALLSLVADDKVWQREHDKVGSELKAAKVEIERQRSLMRRQYEADAALYKESRDWASRNVELAEHDAIHSILAAEFGGNREVVLAHEMQIKGHDRDSDPPPTEPSAEVVLPKPFDSIMTLNADGEVDDVVVYTADQLRAYGDARAAAAILADRAARGRVPLTDAEVFAAAQARGLGVNASGEGWLPEGGITPTAPTQTGAGK